MGREPDKNGVLPVVIPNGARHVFGGGVLPPSDAWGNEDMLYVKVGEWGVDIGCYGPPDDWLYGVAVLPPQDGWNPLMELRTADPDVAIDFMEEWMQRLVAGRFPNVQPT